jgi:hypothetical protein
MREKWIDLERKKGQGGRKKSYRGGGGWGGERDSAPNLFS